jgi:hypothetical protein
LPRISNISLLVRKTWRVKLDALVKSQNHRLHNTIYGIVGALAALYVVVKNIL